MVMVKLAHLNKITRLIGNFYFGFEFPHIYEKTRVKLTVDLSYKIEIFIPKWDLILQIVIHTNCKKILFPSSELKKF